MGLRITAINVDAHDPEVAAEFWAAALGWERHTEDGLIVLGPAEGAVEYGVVPDMVFERVPEGKAVKNRLHLDLRPDSDQTAELARLQALGARPIDIGQGEHSWIVLADPEGNEFCLLRPLTEQEWPRAERPPYAGPVTLRVQALDIDAVDPAATADFWQQALGWRRTYDGPDEVVLEPPAGSPQDGIAPDLLVLLVPEAKTVKNRIHLDLSPDGDRAAERNRLADLGAVPVQVGQPATANWDVLADPAGNEFCLLAGPK